MGTSRWKPLPPDLPAPTRDLAMRMRALLDDDGLSLRQFAASDDVHYSVTTLHRYFSGQALPPRQLIEVISRRCGGDPGQLDVLYDRASKVGHHEARTESNGAATLAAPEPPRQAPARTAGRRRWMIVAAAAALLGGAAALGLTAMFTDHATTGNELIVNGGFDNLNDEPEDDDGIAKWWASENADVTPEGGLAQITARGGTKQLWDVLFGQSGITVTEDKEYTLRFRAWADKAVRIAARVQEEKASSNYRGVFHKVVALSAEQTTSTYGFTAGFSTGKGQVVFQLGGDEEDYTIYLDDVSLVEHDD